MELNKEELIELGFMSTDISGWILQVEFIVIYINTFSTMVYLGDMWHETNAKTIQDIKDLIRLFK